MAKKRNRVHQIMIRPAHDSWEPPTLRARLKSHHEGTYELIDGALSLGLVPGDVVVCRTIRTGLRRMTEIESLRNGSLGTLIAAGRFCDAHLGAMLDQVIEDWRSSGCQHIARHAGGILSGFWPSSVPSADAEVAITGSAAEYDLDCFISPLPQRFGYIRQMVDLSPHRFTSGPRP